MNRVTPFLHNRVHDGTQNHNDNEEANAERRALIVEAVRDALAHHDHHNGLGGIAGAAAGHRVDDIECLHAADQAGDSHDLAL